MYIPPKPAPTITASKLRAPFAPFPSVCAIAFPSRDHRWCVDRVRARLCGGGRRGGRAPSGEGFAHLGGGQVRRRRRRLEDRQHLPERVDLTVEAGVGA